ncbi:DUF4175 family protein [Pareuzebyella sediminis]|uniref:DUF4175 family protein n=1 Tax=Pareuzebyella sediminis TaxID=2607998 RepID=UPI001E475116|nr:DUF4175 family protein [Pareuzebyella sediminis]
MRVNVWVKGHYVSLRFMSSYTDILDKLKGFIRKYYTKMLIRGGLLFVSLGFLFMLAVLGIEYFLWLPPTGRLILLLAFVLVEAVLLFRYILTPIFYLFHLKSGIDNKKASLLIGKYFPQVGDKLYNLLDLAEDRVKTELLLASIEQRSQNLKPVPFTKAVDLRENLKYAKYLIIPLLIVALVWFSGNLSSFFGSADRVVNYRAMYEPPAPFVFQLLTNELNVLESKSYTIEVETLGEVQPETVYIVIGEREYLMQNKGGKFKYTLSPPLQRTEFYFRANEVSSRNYVLNALKTPSIQNFVMELDYPRYTGRSPEVLKGTGNATVPEGTRVRWEITGRNTDRVKMISRDTFLIFSKANDGESFTLDKKVYSDMSYELATSNQNVSDYEKLAYRFNVVKDAYPTIKMEQVIDSVNSNAVYYMGEATDDYKLKGIKLVYYPENSPETVKSLMLEEPNTNYNRFFYTFPSGLELETGIKYLYYFEATDNDAIQGGKSTKSRVFSMAVLDDDELRNEALKSQQSIIDNLNQSLSNLREQKKGLKEINQSQKERRQLSFNDQREIRDFLRKQKDQENLMQKFSKQLKENLEIGGDDDESSQLLQERLERQELEAKKNARLLEELEKVADKIKKEDFSQRLEELGKKQQNSERNLEQLLELTKRYYVSEKANQLAKDLENEASRQEALSKQKIGQDFEKETQKKLNERFEELAKEMEELDQDNRALKKPLELKIDKKKEEAVKKDQKEVLEEINKYLDNQKSSSPLEKSKAEEEASKKQKSASQKMKEMSESLRQASSSSSEATETEDAEMLRQILDNLVTFSFKQEDLFDTLQEVDVENPRFSSIVREQQVLRDLFQHVDDSLFTLSMRRAELSEFVNEQVTEVYYNIDKTLESLAESQLYQGASYQKYVLTASNELADFLAHVLDNMQQSMMPGQGAGQGLDFQLPDIIKQQSKIQQQMEGMGQSGKGNPQEGRGNGEKGKGSEGEIGQRGSGSGNKEGQDGNSGNKSSAGNSGENGNQGQGQNELSEGELAEIYEIYKAQQLIRQRLEEQLNDMIKTSDRKLAEKLSKQMEDFENDLLENGLTQRSMNKMNNIQHELLKLENAAMEQGRKSERESSSNTKSFETPIRTRPEVLKNYRRETEILNRQALPLRQNFQNKVKAYFKNDD